MRRTVLSHEKLWAANANGRYMWCFKTTFSDGTIEWRYAG